MRSGFRRLRRPGVLLLAAVAGAYFGLATLLPDTPPPAVGAAAAPCSDAEADHDHQVPGHTCGLDAKAMLRRFQDAIANRGAVHSTYEHRGGDVAGEVGALAVTGQVNVGLTAEGLLPGAVEALAARHGLTVDRVLPSMALATLTHTERDARGVLRDLGADPLVRYAEPNWAARVAGRPNDPFFDLQQGAREAQVEQAWDVTTGDPQVLVAILDTGVDPDHPDLRTRLAAGYDFVNRTTTLTDDNGHGTAMAGIVAAEGNNGIGVAGVAHGARVLPVKVADAMGVASLADVAAGIDFAVQRGARVINLSMGTPVGAQALLDAVNRAQAAGVLVVAAAGNDPVHHEMFPAAYPGVISTTVLSAKGDLGHECVVAEGVDVGAPIEEVITTLPGDVYGFVGGSSSAAAYASAVAALALSRDPGLSLAQLSQVLRHAQDPVAALAGLEPLFRFGRLNALRAVQRASRTYVDVAVTDLRLSPRKPTPGQATTARIEVENQGLVGLSNLALRLEGLDAAGGRHELAVTSIASLAMGERREVALTFSAPASGAYRFTATLGAPAGETETQDDARTLQADVSAAAEADLRIVSRTLSTPDLARGSVTATVTVENVGTQAASGVVVDGNVAEVRPRSNPGPAPRLLQRQTIASLAVGARATVQFTWAWSPPVPTGIVRLEARAQGLAGETRLDDNGVWFDFMIGAQGPLQALYQQSNGVDLIPDAPWRLDPSRPYVPVQVFVPSKGGRTAASRLRVTRTEVSVRDTPTGPATPLFDDPYNARPTLVPTGFQIADELGAVRAGVTANDLFGDTELDENGRHDILRLPRAALGVPAAPATAIDKFIDVKVSWEERRSIFFGLFTLSNSGSHRSVLRVRFPPQAFPAIPGENHYHDVHHHTIAEWFFGSPLDLFCPRKAYGGPLQMVFESAYAMGVIAAPTQQAAWGKIITTDHNAFNNRTIPDADGPDHRPPFGPQSPAQNPGVGQLEAYRRIFGPSAGEEVTFKQDIPVPHINIPFVNQVLNVLPGLPLGAHMLTYHADHVEGPWHGGGWLVSPYNPSIDVNLFPLLNDLAKNRQTAQEKVFSYAAHPFSGMGWRDENFDKGFGLDPAQRTRDEVHDGTGEFVVKGLEWFNGRGTRSLPTSAIDFNDLNPWADATFTQGVGTWDRGVWSGMTEWHRFMARTLEYSFVSDPETRFIRKIYQAGGSDAHGDFNFSVSRAATPISIQATYSVGDEAWYGVRTYCLGDGKQGATPEDRWMAAYADGNTVATDGPVMTLSLDAERKFDGARRQWHDARQAAEDHDGRIGGDGPLDGGYTALVRRGSVGPVFRYRYSSTDEFGPVASVLLYKTEPGNPNPTRRNGNIDQIIGVNRLALAGADQDLEQPLDVTKEGPVTKVTAFAAGAYTVGDPDTMDLGPDAYRCYTNPVYAIPYDVDVTVASVDTATATIPAGALTVRWTFDVSMEPRAYAIAVKGLDRTGDSTDSGQPALTTLVGANGSGWSDRPGIKSSVLTVSNAQPIPVSGDGYPTQGRVTFVVYFDEAPRDFAGNPLNSIATTFESQWVQGPVGTTAAAATATPGSGGGGGGGGCALTTPASTTSSVPALFGLLVVALLALRRRR